jgi:tetratricopeptide (TPR) repeat protein
MERKKQLIRLTNYSFEVLHELIANTSAEDLAKSGQVERWSFKDHIAHIAHWLDRFNHRLIKRDKNYKEVTDFDTENSRIWQLTHDLDWQVINNNLEKSYIEVTQYLRSLSEDDLLATDMLYPPDKRPLWDAIISSTCSHTITHVGIIYNERGNHQKSVELLEKIMDDLQAFDPSSKWKGTNIYNLACLHAPAENQPKALELLRESLILNTALVEWAPKDTDLISLWKLPAFIEMTQPGKL